jgi:hypothetical protein
LAFTWLPARPSNKFSLKVWNRQMAFSV